MVEAPPLERTTNSKTLLGKYQLGRLLGRGNFAKVYHARSLTDQTSVAVKVLDKSQLHKTPALEPLIIREISVMRRLHHPNIVRLHEVMATKSKIYFIMEHARGGELFSRLASHGRLTETLARRYFRQLLSALHFCHSNGVYHRDIKPENLLLDAAGNLKVSDFGLSALPEQLKNGLLHTACGTPAYTAPEVVARKGYDGSKADVWSCGVILFVLLAGFLPFNDSNLVEMLRKIRRAELRFPPWFSPAVKRLITRLLDPNPATRISLQGLMEVSWLKMKNLGLESKCETEIIGECERPLPMNAFDIISLSSGFDLSGLFGGGDKRKERRFLSRVPAEEILKRVEEVGLGLGFRVEKKKKGGGGFEMKKVGLAVTVEVWEVAPAVLLVEVSGEGGVDVEGLLELCGPGVEDGLGVIVRAGDG